MPGPFSSPCSPPVPASGPPAHFIVGPGQTWTAETHGSSSSLVPGRTPEAPAGSDALVDPGPDPGWGDQNPTAPDGPPAPFGGSTPGTGAQGSGGLTAGAWIGLAGLAAAGGYLVWLATRAASSAPIPRFEYPRARR